MDKFPRPRPPTVFALLVLAGDILALIYFGQDVVKGIGMWILFGTFVLVAMLLHIDNRRPCSLYYTWEANASKDGKRYILGAVDCKKEPIGCAKAVRSQDVLDGEILKEKHIDTEEYFCLEHDPALPWMRDWLNKERIRLNEPIKYFKLK